MNPIHLARFVAKDFLSVYNFDWRSIAKLYLIRKQNILIDPKNIIINLHLR
jgi:hypothetical protein